MSAIQIIQLITLIWQLLKALQAEGNDPTGTEVKETALAVTTAIGGDQDIIKVITELPESLLADVGKVLAGE